MNKRNAILQILVPLFVILISMSFLSVAQEESTLVVAGGEGETITTIDWQATTDFNTRRFGIHVWEGLATLGEDYDVIPQLAKSWDISEDRTVYTFDLRKGVQFQRGYGEMKADDVKASLDRFFNKGVRKGDFDVVDSVEIVDDYTIKITLDRAQPFLAILTNPIGFPTIMPKEIASEVEPGDLEIPDQVVGTGPYKLDKWAANEELILTKFEDYTADDSFEGPNGFGGNRTAYFDRIETQIIPDAQTRLAGLKTGKFDYILLPPNRQLPAIKDNPDMIFAKRTVQQVSPKFNPKNPPTDSLAMRRALVEAMAMEPMLEAKTGGQKELYLADSSLFHPDSPWSYPALELQTTWHAKEPDLDEAKHLLDIANYDGEKIVIVTYGPQEPVGTVMQQQLKQADINAELKVWDWATLWERHQDFSSWHIFICGHTEVLFDPSTYRYNYYGDVAEEYWGYNSPILDVMVETAATWSREERMKAYKGIQLQIAADLNTFSVGYNYLWDALKSSLEGKGTEDWYIQRFWNIKFE